MRVPAPLHRTLHRTRRRLVPLALLAVVTAACAADTADTAADAGTAGTVTVYTGRHYGAEAVFDAFTAETGIEVRFTTGSDPELRERLLAEGENSPADVFMTADAANIALAADAGLLAPLDSPVLVEAIPAELRAGDGTWFSLSRRLRVIAYSPERVAEPPTTYAALGDPEWADRLCLRPGSKTYTQSLVAALIRTEGRAAAEDIVAGWVANDPIYINSDTDMLRAIAAGDCDVAIVNTYYLARLLENEDPEFPAALAWPEQDGAGAHVNVSAAAVTAAAPNPEGAQQLLEWLATAGQERFSAANLEYPAAAGAAQASVLDGFGTFVADDASVRELGDFNADAVDLFAEVGYE